MKTNSIRPLLASAAALAALLGQEAFALPKTAAQRTGTAATATAAATAATATPSASTATSGSASTSGRPVASGAAGLSNESIETIQEPGLLTEPLALVIHNGLEGLEEEVIPALTAPNRFTFPTTYYWDEQAVSCLRIDAGIKNSSLEAPLTRRSLTSSFGNNGKVLVDFDIDAVATTTLFVDVESADGFSGCSLLAGLDNVADWFVGIFGGSSVGSQTPNDISFEQLTLTAEGLSGEVDLSLELRNDLIQVKSVDQLEAYLGDLDYTGTALVEFLAQLAEAGITLGIGDLEDFINGQFNSNFADDQKDRLKDAVNDALVQNLTVEERIAFGDFQGTVEVEPTALLSSRSQNSMTLELGFAIESTAPTAACATNVSFSGSPLGDAEPSSADFDLQIPHWIIAKSVYEAARQGLLCQETLMPVGSQPWTVAPNGAISCRNGRYTVTTTNSAGFASSTVHHDDELLITVPLKFAGKTGGYSGSATADLQVYAKPVVPEGSRSVYLLITEVAAANVAGSLKISKGVKADLSDVLDTFLNSAADILADRLGRIPLIPRTTTFSDDLALEVADLLINDSHVTVGVDIVPAPETQEPGTGFGGDFELAEPAQPPHLHEDELPELNSGTRDWIDPVP